jgi:hypothetical protein
MDMRYSVLLIIITLFLINLVSAQGVNLQLCINTDCYERNDPNLQNINQSAPLILKVGIIPKDNEFMCFSGFDYHFDIISNNIRSTSTEQPSNQKSIRGGVTPYPSGSIFCLSKDHEYNFFIPLKENIDPNKDWNYNALDQSVKLGSWTITNFNLIFSKLDFHNTASLMDNPPLLGNKDTTFLGNEIIFTVTTEVAKAGWFPEVSKGFRNFLIGLNVIFVLIGGILLPIGLTKRNKNNGYTWLSVLLLLLALILFTCGFFS